MSADNTVAILKTPDDKKGFEYRVIHAQAIENIYWEENYANNNNPNGNPTQVVNYFGKCNVFTNKENAYLLAQEIAKEILADEFCPILEYGISQISLPHIFSYYLDRINKGKKATNERAD